jgi:hypothetical protein
MSQWSSFEVRDLAAIVNAEMFPIAKHCERLYSLPQSVLSR